ncbi:hypothetical protein J6590_037751 [Homalodisca vitripennis]|nr:hypothetical protein J6590_037751 [Homalodisca vitripennis]
MAPLYEAPPNYRTSVGRLFRELCRSQVHRTTVPQPAACSVNLSVTRPSNYCTSVGRLFCELCRSQVHRTTVPQSAACSVNSVGHRTTELLHLSRPVVP